MQKNMSNLNASNSVFTQLNSEDAASINGGAIWLKKQLGVGSFKITKYFKNTNNLRWSATVFPNGGVKFDPDVRQPKKLNRAACQARTQAAEAPLGYSQRSHFC